MRRFVSTALLITSLLFFFCSGARSQTLTTTTVYIYDELGRLKGVITPSGDVAIYSYDAAGNIVSIARQTTSTVSIIEFTPDKGQAGTSVTIYGTGFSLIPAQNSVLFNGVSATVTAASATQLVVAVPSGASTGPISVTTPSGNAVSTTSFEILQALSITGFTPTIGTPGTAVQISGTDFDPVAANNQLKFNITPAVAATSSPTTINTTVPANATSGHITVTTTAGAAVSSGDFFVPPSPFTAASVDHASRIAMNETKAVAVNAANRIALIVFDGTVGQRISLQAANSNISSSTIRVIKPDGTNLLNPTSLSGNWFVEPLTLSVTGTHTIVIDPNSTFTGSMNLTLHNVPSDATAIISPGGPPVTITTTTPGQNAVLTFAGTTGQRISLNVTGVSIADSTVTIRKPDGTEMSSGNVTTSGLFFDTMTLPVAGNYSIFINPTGPAVGSMTFTLNDVPADSVSPIVIGGSHVVVSINIPGQNAQLTFTGTAGQIVELDWQGSLTFSGSLAIAKADGTVVPDTYGLSWNDNILVLPETGTYKININPSGASTGSSTFALYEIPQPVTGTITANGQPVTVTIPNFGQIAKITFQGTAGDQVSLKGSHIKTGPFGSYVEIKAPDGSFLGSIDFADPEFFYVDEWFDYYNLADTMTLPATGTYTITIFPDASSGSMDLTLYTVPPDATGSITPGGSPVTVTTTVPGQDARLTFNGTEGQRVTVKITGTTPPFFPYVCVLDPDGFVVAGSACVWVWHGSNFIDTVVLPATGTYSVRVNGLYGAAGSAIVNLYDLPPDITGTLTFGGPPVTVTATAPGQDAEMTFAGTAGQRMSLKVSGTLPVFSGINIFRPNGQLVSFVNRFIRQIGPVRAELVETTVLPATGTYKIKVNTFNDAGTMTFNLYEVPADVDNGAISIGGPPVTVTSTVERQNRRLTFEGTAGQTVNLRISNGASWLNHISLFRPDGILLASSRADAANSKVIDTTLPLTGTYSILTELFANGDAVTFTLGSGTSDVTGTALLNGQPATIAVPSSQQLARYTFNGTVGQRVGLRMTDVTFEDAQVRITGQELECCQQDRIQNTGVGADRFDVWQITSTGPNAVVVDPILDYTGSVTTRLYDIPPDVTGTITLNGPAVNVTATTPGQNATLTFDGTTGQQVTIHVTNNTVGKITLELYRPTGVCQVYHLSEGGSFDLPLQTLPTPGTYKLSINPWRANTGSVSINLTTP
ncbi:MAG TPA: IPT/TIG domain-containing protein [Pyrinomonadaceae bacterium]|nr:IPT/TIG domain-containing protein [Pyrinomonadaceae bacterium]